MRTLVAVRCPICHGSRLVSRPPFIAGDVPTWMDANTGPYPCQHCENGILWRMVPEPVASRNAQGMTCSLAKKRGVANCNDCCECLSPHAAGKTCNDCLHAPRCKAMFGTQGDETYCQFVPSRCQYPAPVAPRQALLKHSADGEKE